MNNFEKLIQLHEDFTTTFNIQKFSVLSVKTKASGETKKTWIQLERLFGRISLILLPSRKSIIKKH